ncbi:uncharacterized protein LOC114841544 [Diachasma alloeum]|uniref:Ionotropic receptor 140 n=1 Tax=Diachasma alloeum TaxID=454923 RepID=A0A4E0RQU4_9HYME|nr:uncharacterized protein LOC114841544 [Diachasma alloeum]THK33194.1 ionotropic receptor 140 [Diachasma alloeum]
MVIVGDFDGRILMSLIESIPIPIVTIDSHSEFIFGDASDGLYVFQPDIIIMAMEDSPKQLGNDLQLLQEMNQWNHMAAHFILEISARFCKDALESLLITWRMHIPQSSYVCLNAEQAIVLYTLNPITNYAPKPWQAITSADRFNSSDRWTLYSQLLNPNDIACDSLTFDRMKHLNGYEIKALTAPKNNVSFIPGKNYKQAGYKMLEFFGKTVFDTIITRLNATLVLQIDDIHIIPQYLANQSMDIDIRFTLSFSKTNASYLYPYFQPEVIAITRIKDYLSTFEKIAQLWSRSVLVLSFLTILITFGVMAVYKRQGFSLALLEIIRLLSYASIQNNFQSTAMRIFFSKILIFIVITNGVFQGRLAAFLTKPEEGYSPENSEDLKNLNYTLYGIQQNVKYLRTMFPDNRVVLVTQKDCVEMALASLSAACVGTKAKYLNKYWMKPIHTTREPLFVDYWNHQCRKDWPLKHRVEAVLTQIMESGLLARWAFHSISTVLDKKRAEDVERAATKYRPVELKALDFSFALLAFGLVLATIVLIIEFLMKRESNTKIREEIKFRNFFIARRTTI